MPELEGRIQEYVASRMKFLEQEQRFKTVEGILFGEIKTTFEGEIPNLNSKLPQGYSIASYVVCPGMLLTDPPAVFIVLSGFTHDDAVEKLKTCEEFNKLLEADLAAIRRKYGFSAAFSIDVFVR